MRFSLRRPRPVQQKNIQQVAVAANGVFKDVNSRV